RGDRFQENIGLGSSQILVQPCHIVSLNEKKMPGMAVRQTLRQIHRGRAIPKVQVRVSRAVIRICLDQMPFRTEQLAQDLPAQLVEIGVVRNQDHLHRVAGLIMNPTPVIRSKDWSERRESFPEYPCELVQFICIEKKARLIGNRDGIYCQKDALNHESSELSIAQRWAKSRS